MITLAIYKKMLEDKVANLIEGENFFWEEVPLQSDGEPASGVWLITRPGNIQNTRKGLNLRTTVDFYVATEDKVETEVIQQQIRQWLTKNLCFCELSGSIGGTTYSYSNVRVRPTTTPQNNGATENGLIVKVASTELIYDETN